MASDLGKLGYRGYVTCREFGGLRVPVPVQSLMIRQYAERHGLMFKLHVNENIFPQSYMQLEALLNELDHLEGLLAYSMFMLPRNAKRRRKIYQRFFDTGSELHFVLEERAIRIPDDLAPIEDVLTLTEIIARGPDPRDVLVGGEDRP